MKFLSRTVSTCAAMIVALGASDNVIAYETPTHAQITQNALLRSVLNDPEVLYRLGLYPELRYTAVAVPSGDIYPFEGNASWLADVTVWYAAHMEDDGQRSLQHFFDPINDRGLQAVLAGSQSIVNVGLRSWQWALGDATARVVFKRWSWTPG